MTICNFYVLSFFYGSHMAANRWHGDSGPQRGKPVGIPSHSHFGETEQARDDLPSATRWTHAKLTQSETPPCAPAVVVLGELATCKWMHVCYLYIDLTMSTARQASGDPFAFPLR